MLRKMPEMPYKLSASNNLDFSLLRMYNITSLPAGAVGTFTVVVQCIGRLELRSLLPGSSRPNMDANNLDAS